MVEGWVCEGHVCEVLNLVGKRWGNTVWCTHGWREGELALRVWGMKSSLQSLESHAGFPCHVFGTCVLSAEFNEGNAIGITFVPRQAPATDMGI